MKPVTLLLAIALLTTSAAAQPHPDFPGRWTSERAQTAGSMGSGWGPTITVTQDANRLTVEYPFYTPYDMQPPLRFTYALDGSETKNRVTMGRGLQVQSARAEWKGRQLVITTTLPFSNPDNGRPMTSEVTRTLTLESPTSLVVETVFGGALGGPSTTTRTSYHKP